MIIRSVRPQGFRILSIQRSLHSSFVLSNADVSLNAIPISRTRNIGIIAHIDAGKTTTTERMLFYSGKTNRIGNVDEGDTVTDYLPQERDRGITIQLAAISIPWNKHKINIIDTPGHADFTFEVIRSLRVLDGCVTILDAVAGVEAQTEKVWKQAHELGIPKICFVNKMDREGAGFSRTVKEIVSKLQTRVVLCNIPYFEDEVVNGSHNAKFVGVLDVLHKKVLKWNSDQDETGRDMVVSDIEENSHLYEMVYKSRESMIETLGEFDESLIDSFFENEEDYMKVPAEVIHKAIHKACISNFAVPVFCGASFRNIGVQPLMDSIVKYLPSPLEIKIPEVSSEKVKLGGKRKKNKKAAAQSDASLSSTTEIVPVSMDSKKGLVVNAKPNLTTALAFKVITHPIRGVMTFIRVYSGKLQSNTNILNTRSGEIYRLGKLLLMHGDQPETVSLLSSGNIGVITGMVDEIVTGDTIVSAGNTSKNFTPIESNLKMLPIEIPPPVFSASIEPNTVGDKRHLEECIQVLLREDPSLHMSVDEETGQTVLSGMGELHLEIVGDRLIRDLKAKAQMGKVVVTYKESLTSPTKPVTINDEETGVCITLSIDSFEGPSDETEFANEDGSILLETDNNIVVFEPSSMSANMVTALEDRRWKSEYTAEQLQDSIVQGCIASLQTGGPITRLPLHSTVIRIVSWEFPVERATAGPASQLLNLTRNTLTKAINEHYQDQPSNYTLLEPIMDVKVFVNTDTLGEVVQDLNSQRKATILSIEDDLGDGTLDNASWAKAESEKVYVPPDYTLTTSLANELQEEIRNRKKIDAQAPLREMIGYLSKLRSLTQGRGTFDMAYHGMMRVSKDRVDRILYH